VLVVGAVWKLTGAAREYCFGTMGKIHESRVNVMRSRVSAYQILSHTHMQPLSYASFSFPTAPHLASSTATSATPKATTQALPHVARFSTAIPQCPMKPFSPPYNICVTCRLIKRDHKNLGKRKTKPNPAASLRSFDTFNSDNPPRAPSPPTGLLPFFAKPSLLTLIPQSTVAMLSPFFQIRRREDFSLNSDYVQLGRGYPATIPLHRRLPKLKQW